MAKGSSKNFSDSERKWAAITPSVVMMSFVLIVFGVRAYQSHILKEVQGNLFTKKLWGASGHAANFGGLLDPYTPGGKWNENKGFWIGLAIFAAFLIVSIVLFVYVTQGKGKFGRKWMRPVKKI